MSLVILLYYLDLCDVVFCVYRLFVFCVYNKILSSVYCVYNMYVYRKWLCGIWGRETMVGMGWPIITMMIGLECHVICNDFDHGIIYYFMDQDYA